MSWRGAQEGPSGECCCHASPLSGDAHIAHHRLHEADAGARTVDRRDHRLVDEQRVVVGLLDGVHLGVELMGVRVDLQLVGVRSGQKVVPAPVTTMARTSGSALQS